MKTALPIEAILPELRKQLADHPHCLLVAQPGAGKTTQVPQAILDDPLLTPAKGKSRWLMLEPRRVAARLAAEFMASQRGQKAGQLIGYRVRGEQKTGPDTRLEILTQGIFTRILQDDPLLEGVSGVIFDEFHERSLDADLGLALALEVQRSVRPDLKLLIMSATLDVDSLLTVLGDDTPVLDCPGRTWPVTTHYHAQALRDSAEQHQARIIRRILQDEAGNILVFLPGQREIRALEQQLRKSLPADIEICPLHGQLSLAQQQQVLKAPPPDLRRIILSTDIAESSLTVPGVRIVVDAGQQRSPVFQPRSGLTRLETRRVNRASADQRRGRAGREAPGSCHRLWPESQILAAHGEPEMLQADLSALAFELFRWGIRDVTAAGSTMSWVSAPPAAALESGLALLELLGIAHRGAGLTALGQRCARWPTHPRLAVMMEIAAADPTLLPLACWLISWLEENAGGTAVDMAEILHSRPQRDGPGNPGRWFRSARLWSQRARCQLNLDTSSDAELDEGLAMLLAAAFPDRIAQRQSSANARRVYKLVSGGQAVLPENHALAKQQWLIAFEVDGQSSAARIFHAAALPAAIISTVFPESADWHETVIRDPKSGSLKGEKQRRLGSLVLESRPLTTLPAGLVQQSLLEALRQRNSFRWSDEDRQMLGRLTLLHRMLGAPWPDVSDAALLATLEHWLLPFLGTARTLQAVDDLPLGRFLFDSLPWEQQQKLGQLAPVTLKVPSGNNIRIDYSQDEPVLAVKLQELFGLAATPALVNGKVPLLLHLLSPARRPVQVTRDLAGFWAGSYFEVRKDLKGRYPKHPWPDDPLSAQATHRTQRR